MKELISVIVPVYKVEKYITRCIDSIINQTYKNLEIILVDDGSPDGCGKICDEYAKNDERIRVIHKENGGVSSARNIGLDNANGTYITFVDADDYIQEEFCENLIKHITEQNADCVACGYNRIYDNKEEKILCKNCYSLTSNEFIENIMHVQSGLGFCHMKLWRKSSIGTIRFNENLKVGEDALFNMQVSKNVKKFYMVNKALYNYRFNETSVVRKFDNQYANKYLKSIQVAQGYIEKSYRNNDKVLKRFNNYASYHVLLVIINYCLNPENGLGLKDQIKQIKEICDIKEFKDAIKQSNYEGFSLTRKITLFTMKSKLYFLTAIIGKIRQMQFKINNTEKENIKEKQEVKKQKLKEKDKHFNNDIIFQIALALLPLENFFFAPSWGWATVTPIILSLYLLFNFKLLIKEFYKFRKFILFFATGMFITFVNYWYVGFEIKNTINALISVGLGFVSFFSFDIYYIKNKSINKIIKILLISYTVALFCGIVQYLAIKFNVKFIYNIFDIIFKRNYLNHNRVQYFFTEPSFIGMHLFGILLPIYLISKNRKLLYLIIAFCVSAFVFSSGVRILLDIGIVGIILLLGYLIRYKKSNYIFIIPLVAIIAITILYNNNSRIRQIVNDGIYADGSLASRYFRIQSSAYGYTHKPIHFLFGYGLGNSMLPLRDGYEEAIQTYRSSYVKEVIELGDPNYIDDSVSYCLYIRFISELGFIMLIIACAYIFKITKNSKFRCKYSYLLITLYLYLQFESYAFYSIWLFILIMLYTNKELNLSNKNIEEEKQEKSKKMGKRILVFGMTQNPGGVESVIINYYRNINKEKFQFDFLCNTEVVAYEEEILKLGGNIYRITARSNDRKKYKEEMNNFFQKYASRYSTIWVNVCSLANIDYLIYAKKYGIKYRIIHSHNSQNMDSKLRGILHKINKNIVKLYATDFWACSEEAGQWFYKKNIMQSNKYQIVNNAINTEKYRFNNDIRKDVRKELDLQEDLVIGNVGRLHFQKNQIFLLDIFKEIKNIENNAKLVLVGQGEDEKKLKERVKALGLENDVMFLGVRYDVERIIQAFDSFVFPSVFEGLGLSIVEAEASGINVFASKDVIPELVKMSKNFYFISLKENAEYWAKQIINKRNYNREKECDQTIQEIRSKGYDIIIETRKLEKYFERK